MAIEIRKGTREDLDRFVDFLQEVNAGMENREWFYLDSREEFRELMESGVMELWLAMDGDRVAGAFDLLIPGLERYNYGWELSFTREQLLKVVNMDTAAVGEAYRGQGLQRRLLTTAEEWLRDRGDWILLCTIHPENEFSLNNARKLGYEVQKKLPLYGSVRYILRRDIKKR